MGAYNNIEIVKNRSSTFPITESATITSATSLTITCTGSNQVQYLFVGTGEIGTIEPGEKKVFFTNIDPVTEQIDFTFFGAAGIEINYATGTGGGGGGGGDATAANQVIQINILNGNTETIQFVEDTTAGPKNTDICTSCSLIFQGTGGTLSGITVPDGFIVTYTATLRNEVASI